MRERHQLHDRLVALLADSSVGIADLADRVWNLYREAGCPYGETKKGLALWIERLTGTTAN